MPLCRVFIFFPFVLTLCFTAPGLAQEPTAGEQNRLTGEVMAGDMAEPLGGATVALWHMPDSTLVTGVATDADGSFALRTSTAGSLTVRISHVGYERTEFSVELPDEGGIEDLGTMGFDVRRRLDSFSQRSSRNWNARQLQVTFTYNFGQEQQRRRRGQGGGDFGGEEAMY